jgi:hypothetical protein
MKSNPTYHLILTSFLIFFLSFACASSREIERESDEDDHIAKREVSSAKTESLAPSGELKQNKRMMVYSVTVNLQSKEIEPKVKEIIQLAESFGGYALQYSSNGSIQLKIPAEKLKLFLLSLRNQSQNYSEEVSAKDVTEEYLDTEIRLENAQKMRTRLLEILKTAKTLEEILKVEAELNKISESIERSEGRLKYLSNIVQLSSVQVYVRQKWEPTVQKEYKPGPFGYPIYYLYLGLGKVKDGIVWLFVQEVPKDKPTTVE